VFHHFCGCLIPNCFFHRVSVGLSFPDSIHHLLWSNFHARMNDSAQHEWFCGRVI
jgi:hypothetical protein